MREVYCYHVQAGQQLGVVIDAVVKGSKGFGAPALFSFNGEPLCVEPHHTADEVLAAWERSRRGLRDEHRA